jgi:hypothetical protein
MQSDQNGLQHVVGIGRLQALVATPRENLRSVVIDEGIPAFLRGILEEGSRAGARIRLRTVPHIDTPPAGEISSAIFKKRRREAANDGYILNEIPVCP